MPLSTARRRLLGLPVAAALVAASAVAGGTDAVASTAGCPAVRVSVVSRAWAPVAAGISRRDLTIGTSHGGVVVHEVDADLSAGVRVDQTAVSATQAVALAPLLVHQHASVAVNGDFFHVTPYDDGLAADGDVGSASGPVKGWAAESPALSLAGGTARVGWVHLAGTLTFTEAAPAATPHVVALQVPTSASVSASPGGDVVRAGSTGAAPRPSTRARGGARRKATAKARATSRPARTTVTPKSKRKVVKHKVVKHKVVKRKHVVRRHRGISRPTPVVEPAGTGAAPTAPPAATTQPVVTTAPSGARTAVVPLTSLNDDEGLGNELYTSSWGTADRSAGVPSGSVEIDLAGGQVSRITSAIGSAAPGPGTAALVVSGAVARSLSWLAPGDAVSGGPSLVTGDGTPVGVSVSGNAIDVQDGSVQDVRCGLDRDTSVRPRVVVGTSGSGHHLDLLVSDGDVPGMAGLTVREGAEVAAALGLDDALNLDGGNSSQLVLATSSGSTQVNRNSQNPPRVVPDGFLLTAP